MKEGSASTHQTHAKRFCTHLVVFVALIVPVLFLYEPVLNTFTAPVLLLNTHSIVYGRDTLTQDFIRNYYGWERLTEDQKIPLWNPHLFVGIPFIASVCFSPFYPTTLLGCFLPAHLAFNLEYAINLLLGGVFFFLMIRWMNFGVWEGLFGSMLFMMSGHFATLVYPGHLQKVHAIAWLPFVFGAIYRGVEKRALIYFVLAGVGMAMQLVASHLQIFFYTALLIFFHVVTVILCDRKVRRSPRFILTISGFSLLSIVIAGGLAGAQTFSSVEMSSLSSRAGGVSYEEATDTSFPPLETFELILPRFTGDSISQPGAGYGFYWGWWGERLVSDYIGMGCLIFALIGIFKGKGRTRWFFLFVFFVSMFLSWGKYSFLYNVAFFYLPFFNTFRSPGTIMILMTFSLAVLATMGLSYIHTWRPKNQREGVWLGVGIIILGILCIGTYLNSTAAITLIETKKVPSGSLSHDTLKQIILFNSMQHTFMYLASVLLLVGVMVLVKTSASEAIRKIALPVVLGALILVSFFDLYKNDSHFVNAEPIEPYYTYLFSNRSDDVIAGFEKPRRVLERGKELVNRPVVRNITILHGYHPIKFKAYEEVLSKVGFASLNTARLFYIRFWNYREDTELPFSTKALTQDGVRVLAEIQEPLHYCYAPKKIIPIDTSRELLDKLGDTAFNPYETSYVLSQDTEINAPIDNGTLAGSEIVKYDDHRIEVKLNTERESYIVVSEASAPGWEARVDGKLQNILSVNHFFRMVRVGAGTHTLEYTYKPFSFRLGLYISLLFIMALIAVALARVRKKVDTGSVL